MTTTALTVEEVQNLRAAFGPYATVAPENEFTPVVTHMTTQDRASYLKAAAVWVVRAPSRCAPADQREIATIAKGRGTTPAKALASALRRLAH